MRRILLAAPVALIAASIACAHAAPPAPGPPPAASVGPPVGPLVASPAPPPTWPDALGAAMRGRGDPHAPPIALARDARGRERWLTFVGPSEGAIGAWRVTLVPGGEAEVEPVERWPTGARVLGGVVEGGVAYVMLESVGVLDQPGGLHGVWIDAGPQPSPFEGSPMSLSDVHDVNDLAARVRHPPAVGSAERTAVALLSTLRAASASTAMLARAVAAEGADMGAAWQSTFVKNVGHLDAQGGGAPSPLGEKALAIVRAAIATQACATDSCEAWTDAGHAVVRFAVEAGRWVIRSLIEDASFARASAVGPPHTVSAASDTTATESLLRARTRVVEKVLGEAPLTGSGGTIGVGLTDMIPDVPVVAVREGAAAQIFAVASGTARSDAVETQWDAAFADVDGDGRTDVVVRATGKRPDGSTFAWAQAFLAPPASVQVTVLDADLATSLATMDSADARSAAQAATSLQTGGVLRDDACRVLTSASTIAGFRKVATPEARILLFDQPGMPTWRPKVVPSAKVDADELRGLGAHCADLVCSPTRPYCFYASGADSLHAWFVGQGPQLELVGAADYQGE